MSNYTIDGYWDERGFMKPGAENGLLFSLEYALLVSKEYETFKDRTKLKIAAKHLQNAVEYVTRNGGISYFDENGNWSHDNHTALVSASMLLDLDLHEKLFWKGWCRRVHPRDLGYYLALKYPFLRSLFLVPTQIAMIISCAQRYKTRNGVRMVKTDGKLLAWVRFNTIKMPLTKKICTWFIKRHKEFNSWRDVFNVYFGIDHPSSKFPRRVYE